MKPLFILLLFFSFLQTTAQNLKPFEDKNGLYGYKDDKGKIVIVAQYVTAIYFFFFLDKAWVYFKKNFSFFYK